MAGLQATLPLLPLLPLLTMSVDPAVAESVAAPVRAAQLAERPAVPLRPLPAPPAAAGAPLAAPTAQAAWPLPQRTQGDQVRINGLAQQALWQQEGPELWLPLELLEGQLGVSRRDRPGGTLELEWFGQRVSLPPDRQRTLADEVAVPAAALLQPLGVAAVVRGRQLELSLPPSPLLAIRSRELGGGARRVVLDLAGPSLLRSGEERLLVGIAADGSQLRQLAQLGLRPQQQGNWLALQAAGERLSLAGPWRLVLDLPGSGAAAGDPAPPGRDPRLAALLGQGLAIERQIAGSGSRQVVLHSVRLDPRQVPLELRPLSRPDGMQGLSSLSQLARRQQALIAINGGYFNRVNRLPLGALRDDGQWLSGPILNRGAVGWEPGQLPSFGRLSLQESVVDSRGQRWPLAGLNSGYAQRGIARYTAAWGRVYQPLTGQEMAVLLRAGVVVERIEPGGLAGGIPLRPGDELLVARGGVQLPWLPGERLQLLSQPSHPLGHSRHVIGGGPLLLQGGQVVLNGGAEGFSAGFLGQQAPRTVIASDGRQLWLVTLQGRTGAGPTLLETAQLLQQLGARDALNLDGGSSTGLVLGDVHAVMGRGVAAAVHNGLGLVPRAAIQSTGPRGGAGGTLAAGP